MFAALSITLATFAEIFTLGLQTLRLYVDVLLGCASRWLRLGVDHEFDDGENNGAGIR
jgi:hypothetical protein